MKTVIHMAAECMLFEALGPYEFEAALAKFAELVRAAEREACAKVCEERIEFWQRDDGRRYEDEYCADAIRARGQV